MRPMARLTNWLMLITLVAVLPAAVLADDHAPQKPAEQEKSKADPVQAAIDKINELDNGITINREKSTIDIQTKVCLRVGEFLEMFACTQDTREHESILVMKTKPSTIHVSLLLLGLEPGKPLYYDTNFDPPKLVPAKGPKIEIVVVQQADGVEIETPANRWVKDNKTGETMKGNTWLFVGSQEKTYDDKTVYLADVNGSAVSLVNFGDDLLTLDSTLTDANASHNKVWAPRTKAIPEVGTEVILRLYAKPADKADKEAKKDAGKGKEAEKDQAEEPEPAQ